MPVVIYMCVLHDMYVRTCEPPGLEAIMVMSVGSNWYKGLFAMLLLFTFVWLFGFWQTVQFWCPNG